MNNLTVRAKLTLAFSAMGAMVLLIASMSIITLGDSKERFDNYVRGISAREDMAHRVREAIDQRAIAARNLVLVATPEDLAIEENLVLKSHADVGKNLSKLKTMAEAKGVSEEARHLIGEIDKVEQAYSPVAMSIVEMALRGRKEEATIKMNAECRPLLAKLIEVSEEYLSYTANRADRLLETSANDYTRQRNFLVLVCGAAFVAALVAGLLIHRSLSRALGAEPAELCNVVGRLADGDLTAQLSMKSGDTVSVMAAVARMQTSLTEVVSTVRLNSEGVSITSTEIAMGNSDLSARTEQQASALEQTAVSMEQLNATVKQNADNARAANDLAQGASAVAVRGGTVVGQVVDTMKGINDSSKKINEIISVIDAIAFQTNILALNAAVEAARAGEQGLGFAVVASEVRTLAGRSADAAKEIKSLISASVERVEKGAILVSQAGVTMTEVVGSIRRVTDIMGEISAASAEQAIGVGQVGEAVMQLDETTQENAAMVREIAASASGLKGQAQDLVRAVSVFKIGQQSEKNRIPQVANVAPVARLSWQS